MAGRGRGPRTFLPALWMVGTAMDGSALQCSEAARARERERGSVERAMQSPKMPLASVRVAHTTSGEFAKVE